MRLIERAITRRRHRRATCGAAASSRRSPGPSGDRVRPCPHLQPALHARPRHRNLLRRNRPRRLRHGAGACSRTRSTRRWRCTRSTAASCPSSPPAITSGASCRSRNASWPRPARRSPISTASRTREGPGLAGALLVGASVASALGFALGKPVIGVHHMEGHLLSPLLAEPRPAFPFVALLVSGGHSQLFEVEGVGRYRLLGDTQGRRRRRGLRQDGETAGLGYPGGPALAQSRREGSRRRRIAAAPDARAAEIST